MGARRAGPCTHPRARFKERGRGLVAMYSIPSHGPIASDVGSLYTAPRRGPRANSSVPALVLDVRLYAHHGGVYAVGSRCSIHVSFRYYGPRLDRYLRVRTHSRFSDCLLFVRWTAYLCNPFLAGIMYVRLRAPEPMNAQLASKICGMKSSLVARVYVLNVNR